MESLQDPWTLELNVVVLDGVMRSAISESEGRPPGEQTRANNTWGNATPTVCLMTLYFTTGMFTSPHYFLPPLWQLLPDKMRTSVRRCTQTLCSAPHASQPYESRWGVRQILLAYCDMSRMLSVSYLRFYGSVQRWTHGLSARSLR